MSTGVHYVVVPEWLTADKAASRCVELGYERLAEVLSSKEQTAEATMPSATYLAKYGNDFGGGKRLWIGLRKVNGVFKWGSGTPVNYTAWFPTGQPSGDGDCVEGDALNVEFPPGGWNDISCAQPMAFVCERR